MKNILAFVAMVAIMFVVSVTFLHAMDREDCARVHRDEGRPGFYMTEVEKGACERVGK